MAKTGLKTGRWSGTLPAVGTPGQMICGDNDNRTGLILQNIGAGTVYIAEGNMLSGQAFNIPAGGSMNFLLQSCPTVPLFAWGAAGHVLVVAEIIGPMIGAFSR